MGSAQLPSELPCSPVYMGVVRTALAMVARLSWGGVSAVAGCLGNGGLPQQWRVALATAGCLGNGGRPSPTELDRPGFSCACCETLNPEFLVAVLLWGWGQPSLIAWLPASAPFLSWCSSRLLKRRRGLFVFPCGHSLRWLKQRH